MSRCAARVLVFAALLGSCVSTHKAQSHVTKEPVNLSPATEPSRSLDTQSDQITPLDEPNSDVLEAEMGSLAKKFPALEYGKPLALVCDRPYSNTGALNGRPNLQLMWEHYLYDGPRGVWAEVGGMVEYNGCLPEESGGWRNACTVRLSHMLNQAGYKIPSIDGQTVTGGNGDQYFFRLNDMQRYLIGKFGTPDIDINDGTGRWGDIPNVPGLIILKYKGSNFNGHASVWNGAGTVDGADIGGQRILFWKLPCFIPPDRRR